MNDDKRPYGFEICAYGVMISPGVMRHVTSRFFSFAERHPVRGVLLGAVASRAAVRLMALQQKALRRRELAQALHAVLAAFAEEHLRGGIDDELDDAWESDEEPAEHGPN